MAMPRDDCGEGEKNKRLRVASKRAVLMMLLRAMKNVSEEIL